MVQPKIDQKSSIISLKIILYIFIVCLAIAFVTLLFLCFANDNSVEVTSTVDGRKYFVRDEFNTEYDKIANNITQESFNDKKISMKQQAADFLANINKRVIILVDYMVKNNLPNQDIANRLYHRWRKVKLRETSANEKSAAYTVNKGEEMRLCVRYDGKIQDINTAMFIVLHELGHLMSVSYGHNDEFRENFSFVTHLASDLGLYKPQNFIKKPVSYCGTEINTTPCAGGTCKFNGNKMEEFFLNLSIS